MTRRQTVCGEDIAVIEGLKGVSVSFVSVKDDFGQSLVGETDRQKVGPGFFWGVK